MTLTPDDTAKIEDYRQAGAALIAWLQSQDLTPGDSIVVISMALQGILANHFKGTERGELADILKASIEATRSAE